MALTNIAREPRREITEQAVGTLAFAFYCTGDYFIVTRLLGAQSWPDIIFGVLIFGIIFFLAVVGGAFFLHAIGESVCDGLRALGLDPRPRQRR